MEPSFNHYDCLVILTFLHSLPLFSSLVINEVINKFTYFINKYLITYYIPNIILDAQDKSINKANNILHLHGANALFRGGQQEANVITI